MGEPERYIEQPPNFFPLLRIEMLNGLYILEALRYNNIMPGLLPARMNQKGYRTTA